MNTVLKYLELKTGFSNNGPAWIARVSTSKSGQTIYFNGRALRKSAGQGGQGNYVDIETSEEFWISGVKRSGSNRHSHGSGKIKIEAACIEEFLCLMGQTSMDKAYYDVINDIVATDINYFSELENKSLVSA
jgi:hypothetical protein